MKTLVDSVNSFIVQVIETFFVHEYEEIDNTSISFYIQDENINKD